MAGKFFGIPFAATGDKTAVPDAVQPDGSVSYTQGFGFDYERANTDPAYKPVPREQTNQLYFDLTEALGIAQRQGVSDWADPAVTLINYPINAMVRHLDEVWISAGANNSSTPGANPDWASVNGLLFAPAAIVGASSNARMSLGSASASGSFSATEVVVGTSLTGRRYRLASVSESVNLASVGAGGMDVGLAPVNGFVALYLIFNPTTLDVALLGRDVTSISADEVYGGANMPAGYTASALVSVVKTNGSRLMLAHILAGRKVSRLTTPALSASSTQRASPFRLAIDTIVPINAKSVSGSFSVGSTASALCSIGIGSTSAMIGEQATGLTGNQLNPSTGSSFEVPIAPSDPQAVYYTATTTAGTMNANINISGYEF